MDICKGCKERLNGCPGAANKQISDICETKEALRKKMNELYNKKVSMLLDEEKSLEQYVEKVVIDGALIELNHEFEKMQKCFERLCGIKKEDLASKLIVGGLPE